MLHHRYGRFLAVCCAALTGACGAQSDEQAALGAGASGGGANTSTTTETTATNSDIGSGGASTTGDELCGNEIDDDADGQVDEDCGCEVDDARDCYEGDPALAGVGECAFGTQYCEPVEGSGAFVAGAWSACDESGQPSEESCDGLDNDCDGDVDEDLVQSCDASCGSGTQSCEAGSWTSCEAIIVEQDVDVQGDCVWVGCPAETPYPVGCDIDFVGGDARGCVAYVPGETNTAMRIRP